MRKTLYSCFLAGFLMISAFAQDGKKETFTNEDRKYNDWSVSVFAGTNLIQSGDLTSWGNDHFTPGYDLSLGIHKQITHAFGLYLQGNFGKTSQQYGSLEGETEYISAALMGDVNVSNILRRADNDGKFNWAAHLYAGIGIMGYEASRQDGPNDPMRTITDIDFGSKSMFLQGGAGIRYRLSRRLDVEFRSMYVYTGDEEFDASGDPNPGQFTVADIEEGRDDAFFTFNIGVHVKLGKHETALQWHDPRNDWRAPIQKPVEPFNCVDEDNDAVCDQWDRCPDTPEGVKVDGSGCSLDTDGDGVVDSNDKCPTVKGPPNNLGCPEVVKESEITSSALKSNIDRLLKSVEFAYNSDKIRPVSYEKLNEAAEIIIDNSEKYSFLIEGHTDAAGSAKYNQELSERRANSVVAYLVNKGVDSSKLKAIGKGESELKHVECDPASNCPPWKNLENRRVVIQVIE